MPSETVDSELPAAPRAQRRPAARTLRLGFVQAEEYALLLGGEAARNPGCRSHLRPVEAVPPDRIAVPTRGDVKESHHRLDDTRAWLGPVFGNVPRRGPLVRHDEGDDGASPDGTAGVQALTTDCKVAQPMVYGWNRHAQARQ